jgi:DNA-directed RNA polymerase subunit F
MLTDERLNQLLEISDRVYPEDVAAMVNEIKSLRSVLSSIAEIVPETAPEAWMVQEAKDALGVSNVE